MGHVTDGGEGVIDDVVGFLSTEISNSSHAAVGSFIIPLVQSAGGIRGVTWMVEFHGRKVAGGSSSRVPSGAGRENMVVVGGLPSGT